MALCMISAVAKSLGRFYARLTDDSSCREFEVDSINFAGQTHRWRLSGLLQRGRDRRRDALLTDLALATRFLVVTAKARLVSHCFSVSQSLKALLTGLLRLLGEQFASFVRLYVMSKPHICNTNTALYLYMCNIHRLNVTFICILQIL